ncbi:MAG: tRNA lysidine(34) synthetase TilS [Bryobacterales bacterium]|nr:tRNA lysidine(34) synthetase TilS [Bryobacterales bacterium]
MPHALVLKARGYLKQHAMLDGARRLGVAVSGGADSMALLHVLMALREELAVDLTVVHVNHGLRGAESDADEAFVRGEADRLGMDVYVHRIAPGAAPSTGVELWARDQRIACFARLMAERAVDRIATGHTRRDQAETVLFRLLRGAGPRGLSGIAPVSGRGILRPLLSADREEVLCFLQETGVRWREDASNADPRFARNRLRNQWMPALRAAWNPQLDRALAQTAEILAQESDFLAQIADKEASRVFALSEYGYEAPVDILRAMHPALLRRMLRGLAAAIAGSTPEFRQLERMAELAAGPAGYGRFATHRVLTERSGGAFRMTLAEREGARQTGAEAIAITGPGRYSLPGVRGIFELAGLGEEEEKAGRFARQESGYTGGWGVLRPLSPGCVLHLRRWRPGDVFHPFASSSTRKLKELFQRASAPRWRRVEAAVLEADGEIAWCRYLGASALHGLADADGVAGKGLRVGWLEDPECSHSPPEAFVRKENG